jgi:hypothetical protein
LKTKLISHICKEPKYLLRLYKDFGLFMNSLHGCLQKQLMMEHDVSDGGPCYVAQKDGPNYSKQAFFRFFVVRLQCSAENRSENFYGALAALSSS